MRIMNQAIAEQHGLAVRVVLNNGVYSVEYSPLMSDGSYDDEDFSVFGGSVGMSVSSFLTEDKAQEFYHDVLELSHPKLAEKYPNVVVE